MGLGLLAGICFVASALLGPKLAIAGLLFLAAAAVVGAILWLT